MSGQVFRRRFLAGFAFKAVVIGGGYATGRELVEFFLPSGPWGGLFAMLLAGVIWSVVSALTFLLAFQTNSLEYKAFFRQLLGPFWVVFEIAYFPFIVLLLSVFGAAAGAIGAALLGLPPIVGTLALMAGIALATTFGNESVEKVFFWVSIFLYAVYAAFLALSVISFGDRIHAAFADFQIGPGVFGAGLTYAGYNIVGATVILPIVRHMTSRSDAVVSGLLCGPLAMAPAALFFVCMCAFYPQIGAEALPSNFLLEQMNQPVFQAIFQVMIFAALLESGTGAVHAINERIASTWMTARAEPPPFALRTAIALAILVVSIFVASRFGLVELIAKGYRALSWLFITIYVVPLLTFGVWKISRRWKTEPQPAS